MKRVLVLYYSQSGDVAQAATAFSRPLRDAGAEVVVEQIQPNAEYPYPWRSLGKLFSVFPESVLGLAPSIKPMSFGPDEKFDLVVLAYQIWFLAPSLPVQGFLSSPYSQVLRGCPTITLCVNRKMWHSGSETCKEILRALGAVHLDNVVVTFQGPPSTTFVTAVRSLLGGRRDRFLGFFPPAGVGSHELARLEQLGAVVASQLASLDRSTCRPLLAGRGAVRVIPRYVMPERLALPMYRRWARLVLRAGKLGNWARHVALGLFMLNVVACVIIGLPLVLILSPILRPLLSRRVSRYARQLAEPSGE